MPRPVQPQESFADMPFPLKGIDLSRGFGMQQPGTTPVGVNVRAYEPGTARARGGRRPGLLKYISQALQGGVVQDLNTVVGVGYTPPGSTGVGQIRLVQTKTASGTSAAFTSSVTAGSTVCVLVYAVDTDSNVALAASSVTDSQGNVYTKATGTGGPGTGVNPGGAIQRSGTQASVWYFVGVAAGALTVTVTYSGATTASLTINEVAGAASVDVAASQTGSGSPATVGPVTTTQAGGLAFAFIQAFIGINELQTMGALGGAWTSLGNTTSSRPQDLNYQVLGAVTTLSPSWGTFSATDQGYTACVVVFKAVTTSGQSSQSGRIVSLVAVSGGVTQVANAGDTTWAGVANATGTTLAATGVVRSASNNQKLWYADGTHYLYYDPSDNAMHSWLATAGTLPADTGNNTPRLICTWRGRTVLSGLLLDGQNWFMSKVGDPTNFDYFPLPITPTQAIAGNNSTLGLVGDVITALIPYSDDVLVFGGDHTVWLCQGDPMAGGSIQLVSDTIGMAWGNPWCKGPDGTLYFFSNKMGVYSMQIGTPPTRMSQQVEQLLSGLDTGSNIIRLQWDDLYQGFHVWITPAASAQTATHLFWEQRTGAWWQDSLASNNYNPLCCCTFDGNASSDRRSLFGGWDGYVRCMSPSAADDDGLPISSSVVIGPLLTKDLDDVLLKSLQALLGITSGAVTYAVYVGSTAEQALANPPVVTGAWIAGRNLDTYVRRAGHAVYVKITATTAWSMETIRACVAGKGKVRRRGY